MQIQLDPSDKLEAALLRKCERLGITPETLFQNAKESLAQSEMLIESDVSLVAPKEEKK